MQPEFTGRKSTTQPAATSSLQLDDQQIGDDAFKAYKPIAAMPGKEYPDQVDGMAKK